MRGVGKGKDWEDMDLGGKAWKESESGGGEEE